MKFQKIRGESAEQLKALHDTVYESIMTIKSIGVSVDNWNQATILNYECQLKDVRQPQEIADMLNYIESRFMALNSAAYKTESVGRQKDNKISTTNKCAFCAGIHSIFSCEQFTKKSAHDRYEWVKNGKKMCKLLGCTQNPRLQKQV